MEESLRNMNQKYQYVGFLPRSVRIKQEGFWGVNDFEGNQILPSNYIEIFTLSSGHGLIAARDDGFWSIYDFNGNKVNEDKFDCIYPYYGLFGMTKVRIGDYWGLINRFGKLITQIKYTKIEKFGKGIIFHSLNKEIEFVEKTELFNMTRSTNLPMPKKSRKPLPKNIISFPNKKTRTTL